MKAEIIAVAAEVEQETGTKLTFMVGTMIELPRAVMVADQIAESAEFFSFGTNDLTQMTWGFSRDDVEASFFSTYLDKGIFPVSPFESLDVEGVGLLVAQAVQHGPRGATRPAPRRVRRARGRPGLDPLLRRSRPGLRVVLALSRTRRAARGRPVGDCGFRVGLRVQQRDQPCVTADPVVSVCCSAPGYRNT